MMQLILLLIGYLLFAWLLGRGLNALLEYVLTDESSTNQNSTQSPTGRLYEMLEGSRKNAVEKTVERFDVAEDTRSRLQNSLR